MGWNIMFKCFFIYLFFCLWSLAQLWRTHFFRVSPPFCVKWRVPVGIDFLVGSQLQGQKCFPPKPRKYEFLDPFLAGQFSAKCCFIMGRLISKLTSIVTGTPKSCIVNRKIWVGVSKYAVISDPLPPGHVSRRMRNTVFAVWSGLNNAFC